MRKIDKTVIMSKNYERWVSSLGDLHPAYDSSNNRYYNDIKMSLLYCQNGLCAYTEERLCDEKLLQETNWDKERYIASLNNSENLVNGDLEHFDESLKKRQAWLWDNLFFVDGDINRKVKCSQEIREILKPDAPHYDPYRYLSFNHKLNIFTANPDLSDEEQSEVECMIRTLGINANAFKRENLINRLVKAYKYGLELEGPNEYVTAWQMTLQSLQNNKL